jgi:hypothetical protein
MDPFAPIQGISLERYAELGAEISHTQDPEEQARIVGALGVARPDWEAAKQGWTQRMQDMSLMGRVAMAYMPLYQAALARKQGTVSVSFDDWAAMEAAAQVFGIQGMLSHYGIDQAKWTQIAGHWTNELSRDPMRYGAARMNIHQQETARLRVGGQPRPVQIHTQAPAAAAPAAAAPQAQGQPAAQAAPFSAGDTVLVQWSDGNRYPARVTQVASGQAHVQFPNGQELWVELRWLSRA